LDRVFSRQGFAVYNDFETEDEILTYVCLPTKRHWRNPSQLDWIEIATRALAKNYWRHGITTLAIPALGCGLGELAWEDVKPILVHYFDPLPLRTWLYPPQHHQLLPKKIQGHTPS